MANHRNLASILLQFILLVTHIRMFWSVEDLYQQNGTQVKSSLKLTFNSFPQNSIETNTETKEGVNRIIVSKTPRTPKKWQVGRVTRKNYVIVNMLQRKIKIFDEDTEAKNAVIKKCKRHCSSARPMTTNSMESISNSRHFRPKTTSSSFIEFYYLDNSYDPLDHKNLNKNAYGANARNEAVTKKENLAEKLALTHFPIILFRNNEALHRNSRLASYQVSDRPNKVIFFNYIRSPPKTRSISISSTIPRKNNSEKSSATHTTFNDRIKFFETYDSNTPESTLNNKAINYNITKEENIKNIITHNERLLEENYFQNSMSEIRYDNNNTLSTTNTDKPNELEFKLKQHTNDTSKTKRLLKIPLTYEKDLQQNFTGTGKYALWTDYPFVAVYTHEQSRLHCDAAGISPYWLIASAACLSRHQKDTLGDGRSAFVTYCGENWRNPMRISYVKNTVVHPSFRRMDQERKHLYNIGLIKVATSMLSSCRNWSPVSLMSHQFLSYPEGTVACAVGWGLDKYSRCNSKDLPNRPLTEYQSIMYSDSCTESNEESAITKGNGIGNVYCLALPPYAREKSDPVHGSLLLVGGKLIALYLQELQWASGEQFAKYTGIWRLTSWINDVASKPDEIDVFTFDIYDV